MAGQSSCSAGSLVQEEEPFFLLSAVRAAIIFVSAFAIGNKLRHVVHPLACHLFVGIMCTEQALDMVQHSHALHQLQWIGTVCKAFVAFETATHIARWKEIRKYTCYLFGKASMHVLLGGALGWLLATATFSPLGSPVLLTSVRVAGQQISVPVPAGSLAIVTALAIALLFTVAEPTSLIQLVTESRAQGKFTASALRITSASSLFSLLATFVATPVIAQLQHGILVTVLSCSASILLTLIVAFALSRIILLLLYLPLKKAVLALSPKLSQIYGDDIDRALKSIAVIFVASFLFWLASLLDAARLPNCQLELAPDTTCGPSTATVMNEGRGGLCIRDLASTKAKWSIPLIISFQPWPACFLASLAICWRARRGAAVRWRLHLQPLSSYIHAVLGTVSGMWLLPSAVLGGGGIAGVLLFACRHAFISILAAFSVCMSRRRGEGAAKHSIAAGLLYPLQAQVALCVLWELQARAPALGSAPYALSTIGGVMIFLELVFGPPLMRFALWILGEIRSDSIGRATVLGAEGAPPVITLKLIEWEVRAGPEGSHIGRFQWRVVDEEKCAEIDEVAVRRILLRSRPDAFVSMMEEDTLNLAACELLLSTFEVPRCVVHAMDPDFCSQFLALGDKRGGGRCSALDAAPGRTSHIEGGTALGGGGSTAKAQGDVCVCERVSASMQNLLDQFINSPQSAIMLLQDDPHADVIKVTITEHEAGMRISDMKLPDDMQILTIRRGQTPIVPHGHTRLQKTDEIMVAGRPESLASVTAMKKGKVVLLMRK